jgi:hypothetical protein
MIRYMTFEYKIIVSKFTYIHPKRDYVKFCILPLIPNLFWFSKSDSNVNYVCNMYNEWLPLCTHGNGVMWMWIFVILIYNVNRTIKLIY